MESSSQEKKKELVLFFDWDETVTSHDTLNAIAPPDGTHPGPAFSSYGEAYFADLKAHDAAYPDKERNCIASQMKYLESLDEVELASQERIERGGLFEDFDSVLMDQRAVEKVRFREGWREMTSKSASFQKSKGLEMHIISVGWSARFIKAGLQGTITPTSICANEIELDPQTGKGTGKLTKSNDAGGHGGNNSNNNSNPGIRIAQHKLREMKRILAGREGSVLKIFAGDSNTDLPALLEADVGLILGENKGIRDTIDRLGLASHLSNSVGEWKEKRSKRKGGAPKPDLILVVDWFRGAQVIEALQAESIHKKERHDRCVGAALE
ncbi:hypothetical protein CBS101457_002755 [Exobasidium rhododendri]|nr:hypothetical protein CBS101457_002755 [Exobasidium rhododendri]